MLGGALQFFLCQLRHFRWSDEGPMTTDRTLLKSPPTKAHRLQGHTRNPDGREQVPASAAHDGIGAEQVTTTAREHSELRAEPRKSYHSNDLATTSHETNGTPR